jgi:hypothetical protein
MARRLTDTLAAHPWLVCDVGGRVAGYATPRSIACVPPVVGGHVGYVDAAWRRPAWARAVLIAFTILAAQDSSTRLPALRCPTPPACRCTKRWASALGVYRRVGFAGRGTTWAGGSSRFARTSRRPARRCRWRPCGGG